METVSKLEVFDGKQTSWEGLWYHPETAGFSSASINLSALKKFKGAVRLYVRKNKFYNKGENGRPNYVFCLRDSRSPMFEIGIEEDGAKRQARCYYDDDDDCYYGKDGERLYTYDEVQKAINGATSDALRGYTDNIVSDYIF